MAADDNLRYLTLSEVLEQFSQIHDQDWIKDGYYSILAQILAIDAVEFGNLSGGELSLDFRRGHGNTRLVTLSKARRLRVRLEVGINADPKQESTVRVIQTAPDIFRDVHRGFKKLGLTRLEADDFRRPLNVHGGHEGLGGVH